ncbi:MAG TPA: hypothetical protein VMX56_04435 [Anaerolineales bacterium]|nr:hypothetical protein [Anaerolineales bacterium]
MTATEALLSLMLLSSPAEMATVSQVQAPTTLSIIACRTVDLTGQKGRQDPALAAPGWRDLEWFINPSQELECKREVADLLDSAEMMFPHKTEPLEPDFSNWSQCASAGMSYAAAWNEKHKGWAVLAVGCPVKIIDSETGNVLSFKIPECPSHMPGTENRIKCSFDESLI